MPYPRRGRPPRRLWLLDSRPRPRFIGTKAAGGPTVVTAEAAIGASATITATRTISRDRQAAVGASPRLTLGGLKALVIAYIYPTQPTSPWDTIKAKPKGISFVVMNQDSGKPTSENSDYNTEMAEQQAAGLKILAYVDSNYTAETLATVEGYMANFRDWYDVDGFFVDRPSADAADIAYYRSLQTWVNANMASGKRTIVLNHGIEPAEVYMGVCDISVTFEGTTTEYGAATFSTWQWSYPRDRFAHIIYSESTLNTSLDRAMVRPVGHVYITDDVPANQYDTLPTYWETERQKLLLSGPSRVWTAAVSMSMTIASSGVKVSPPGLVTRSAALDAATAIAASGQRYHLRSAAVGATGAIAAQGVKIVQRTAALGAQSAVQAAYRRDHLRQTAIGAQPAIQAAGAIAGIKTASAAITASGTIAVAYRREHLRQAALGAGTTIAVSVVRQVSRQAALSAQGEIAAAGVRVIVAVERSAALSATGTIAVAGAGWQVLRPTADSVDGDWTNEVGGTDLVGSIDDTTVNDSDFIRSAGTDLPSACRFKLSAGEDPQAGTRTLRTRAYVEEGTGDITISIRQGGGDVLGAGVLVDQFVHADVGSTVTEFEDNLTGTVSDWTNLYVEVEHA